MRGPEGEEMHPLRADVQTDMAYALDLFTDLLEGATQQTRSPYPQTEWAEAAGR